MASGSPRPRLSSRPTARSTGRRLTPIFTSRSGKLRSSPESRRTPNPPAAPPPSKARPAPPTDAELHVPQREAEIVSGVAADLQLAGSPATEKIETIAAYFRRNFRY